MLNQATVQQNTVPLDYAQHRNFYHWMMRNFSSVQLIEISKHGASQAWTGLTDKAKTTALYDQYCHEMYEILTTPNEPWWCYSEKRDYDWLFDRAAFENDEDSKAKIVWLAAQIIASEEAEKDWDTNGRYIAAGF